MDEQASIDWFKVADPDEDGVLNIPQTEILLNGVHELDDVVANLRFARVTDGSEVLSDLRCLDIRLL